MRQGHSLYEEITNRIIAELENGIAPWVKPWETQGGNPAFLPANAVTKKRYRGINILILWYAAIHEGYGTPTWIGFHQAQAAGGYIRKGEKATTIVFGSTFVPKEQEMLPEEEKKRVPFLKARSVFNIDQTEGLPDSWYQVPHVLPLPDAIAGVERFLEGIGAQVRHGGDQAVYSPQLDCIALPFPSAFESAAHYYATSLHEHAHWSGHESRLSRDLQGRFGDQAYAAEELVAELTSAYLCAELSIPGQLRHAEYLGSWAKLLQDNRRALFTAAAKATEAAQFLSKCSGGSLFAEGEGAQGDEE